MFNCMDKVKVFAMTDIWNKDNIENIVQRKR